MKNAFLWNKKKNIYTCVVIDYQYTNKFINIPDMNRKIMTLYHIYLYIWLTLNRNVCIGKNCTSVKCFSLKCTKEEEEKKKIIHNVYMANT